MGSGKLFPQFVYFVRRRRIRNAPKEAPRPPTTATTEAESAAATERTATTAHSWDFCHISAAPKATTGPWASSHRSGLI